MMERETALSIFGSLLRIWTGTQFQTVDRAAAARPLDFQMKGANPHNFFLGGGFGSSGYSQSDFVVEPFHVAKAAGVQ